MRSGLVVSSPPGTPGALVPADLPYVTPDDFAGNDSAKVQQALDHAKPCALTRDYTITTALVLSADDKTVLGLGGRLVTSLEIDVLTITGQRAHVTGLRIEGSGHGNGAPTAQNGLTLNSARGAVVIDTRIQNCGGWGVQVNGGSPFGGTEIGVLFSDLVVRACHFGWHPGASAEYVTVTGFSFTGNSWGVIVAGGNTKFVSGSILENVIGVRLDPGPNDGHGIFADVFINHNTLCFEIHGPIVNGMRFVTCNIYSGELVALGDAQGIRWERCVFDDVQFNLSGLAGSAKLFLDQCLFGIQTSTITGAPPVGTVRAKGGTHQITGAPTNGPFPADVG